RRSGAVDAARRKRLAGEVARYGLRGTPNMVYNSRTVRCRSCARRVTFSLSREQAMSHAWDYEARLASDANALERAAFIRRTYAPLAVAILAFVGLETLLLRFVNIDPVMQSMFRGGNWGMLILLVAFVAFGWLAQYWAQAGTSRAVQYAGLGLYV